MYCPGCNSKLGRESLLGALGTMKHYRCRGCGVMSCKRVAPRDIFGRPVRRSK